MPSLRFPPQVMYISPCKHVLPALPKPYYSKHHIDLLMGRKKGRKTNLLILRIFIAVVHTGLLHPASPVLLWFS